MEITQYGILYVQILQQDGWSVQWPPAKPYYRRISYSASVKRAHGLDVRPEELCWSLYDAQCAGLLALPYYENLTPLRGSSFSPSASSSTRERLVAAAAALFTRSTTNKLRLSVIEMQDCAPTHSEGRVT